MKNGKLDIQKVTTEQVKYLDKVLDKSDLQSFKKLIPELKDTWTKKQVYRTETEMRVSVLNDFKRPTRASKYWQCVREQAGYFENLMGSSFEYRENDIDIEEIKEQLKTEKNKFKKKRKQIDLERKLWLKANMELVAKDRMRELNLWSKLKKELNDGSFDDRNVNTHQFEALTKDLEHRVNTLSPASSQPEVYNAKGQLETAKRLKKEKSNQ
jgi:flagellar biosynthesis/type III secretory pathway chaperone|tara:strand:- start:65 stop:700 length:636 start_codon:yes stop_codon:yes gene_type:complete